jgi:hypothetical protein
MTTKVLKRLLLAGSVGVGSLINPIPLFSQIAPEKGRLIL